MRRKRGQLIPLELAILDAAVGLRAQGTAEFHGYLLAKNLKEVEGARRLVGHGTLYKALDRLESAGLIESRWEDPELAAVDGRPRRRLYRVTAAGSAALAETRRRQEQLAQLRTEGAPAT
jgi:DNA-binding PadR family transcriptional regulator